MLARNRYLMLGAAAVVVCLAVLVLRRHAPTAQRATAPAVAASRAVAAAPVAAAPAVVVADDEPAGALRLEGQVIDDADAPIAGAVIAVNSNPPRRTTSDAAGAFAFDGLLPRTYTVEARAGERVGGPMAVRLSDKTEPLTMRLITGGRADVKVIDERSGDAVEAASVELGGRLALTASTDVRGIAAFAGVTAGRHAVRVTAPDYAPAVADLVLGGASAGLATVTVVMRRGAAVGGLVVGPAGAPVPGATVSLEPASDLVLSVQPETVTADAGGHWQFAAVARGTFRFTARGDAGGPMTTPPISLDGATPRQDIVLRLAAGGRLGGTVVDAGGAPVQFALVRVTLPGSVLRPQVRETTTDAAGKFTLAHLPRARLDVIARAAAASSPVTTVELVQDSVDVILKLSNGEAITGVVVSDDGKPVADAQVTAVSTTVLDHHVPDTDITDQDGRFALRGLTAGDYRIWAARRSLAWQGLQRDGIEVHTGAINVRLVLHAGGAIHGRLAYASGGTPSRFTLTLGLSAPHVIASGDGSFVLRDVPAGTVRLVASGSDFVASTVPELVVEPGKDTDVGTLTVARGRSISGHVVDRDGQPVGNAKVLAATRIIGNGRALDGMPAEVSEQLQGKTAKTDAQGAFLLSGLGDGSLVVAAEHPSAGRSGIVPVAAGAGSVSFDLALQPVGTISGLVTQQGQPLVQAIVTATPQGAPEAVLTVAAGGDGSFHFDSVAPGSYTVSAVFAEGGSARSKAGSTVVRSGEDARVDLDLSDSGVRLLVSAQGGEQATMFAQVIVSSVHLASGTAAMLQRQLAQQTDRSLHTGFIMKGHAAVISSVTPGDYTLCGIKLPGDPSDPNVAAGLLHAADKLAAICQSVTVAAAPGEQQVAVTLR